MYGGFTRVKKKKTIVKTFYTPLTYYTHKSELLFLLIVICG